MKTSTRIALTALALATLGGAGYSGWRFFNNVGDAPKYKLAKIEKGPLAAVVAATGTLNPVVSVQVGSQVSGQIKEILVDFNSPVKAGQTIARLDPETFQHRVRQAEADLDASRASLGVQHAERLRARANLADAQRDLHRKQSLLEKNFISGVERDKAQTAFDLAQAAVQVADSQVQSSEAQIKQRQAQLAQARIDLDRTVIKSPVDGSVVKRSIEPGQTVAASLQSPELFVIAKDLSDMQVDTSIDEADVGRIRVGQKAGFSVDAFAGRQFSGEVRQIRKAATVVSNVVTYTVIVSAPNPSLNLLPGMTANVRIVTAQAESVLKTPNAALRFRPPNGAEDKKPAPSRSVPPAPTFQGGGSGRVWVVDSTGKPQTIAVKLGLSDGSMTEIHSEELTEGREVIVGLTAAGNKPPSMPGPRLF